MSEQVALDGLRLEIVSTSLGGTGNGPWEFRAEVIVTGVPEDAKRDFLAAHRLGAAMVGTVLVPAPTPSGEAS